MRQQDVRAAINILKRARPHTMPGRGRTIVVNAARYLALQLFHAEANPRSIIGLMKTKPQKDGRFWERTGKFGPKLPKAIRHHA